MGNKIQLVINTFGAKLSVSDGVFSIKTKNGHQHLTPEQVESITISSHTRVSGAAILLATTHNIHFLVVNHFDFPECRLWSGKYGSLSTIRKKQVLISQTPSAQKIAFKILQKKFDNQLQNLQNWVSLSTSKYKLKNTYIKIKDITQKLYLQTGANFESQMRTKEAIISKYYYSCFNSLIKEPFSYTSRSKHPSIDAVSAVQNYLYGILYGLVETAIIKSGMDPYCGFFHVDGYNKKSFVFDLIEPYRPWADDVFIAAFNSQELKPSHFTQTENEIKLNEEGKKLIVPLFFDSFKTQITHYNGKNHTKVNHIQNACNKLAKHFLNWKFDGILNNV